MKKIILFIMVLMLTACSSTRIRPLSEPLTAKDRTIYTNLMGNEKLIEEFDLAFEDELVSNKWKHIWIVDSQVTTSNETIKKSQTRARFSMVGNIQGIGMIKRVGDVDIRIIDNVTGEIAVRIKDSGMSVKSLAKQVMDTLLKLDAEN